jgi:Flp pilus assembly pilin Flp
MLKIYVKFSERKGQTMTEYALIMAAIAVAAYAAYTSLGSTITTEVGKVTSSL